MPQRDFLQILSVQLSYTRSGLVLCSLIWCIFISFPFPVLGVAMVITSFMISAPRYNYIIID